MTKFRIFLLVFALVLCSMSLFAATRTSSGSGNWNDNATWGGFSFPIAGDDVVIATGHLVTLTADAFCKNLTMQGLVGTRLAIGSSTLTTTGTVNGPSTNFTNAVVTTSGAGKLKFTGASRALFGLNWTASHNDWRCEVALNSGSTGTTSTMIKIGYLTVTSGTFQVGSPVAPRELRIDGIGADNSGSVYIAANAALICTGNMGMRTPSLTSYCGDIDIYGTLTVQGDRLNGNVNVHNNGTLIVKKLSNAAGLVSTGGVPFNFNYAEGSTLQYDLEGTAGRMPTGAEIANVTGVGTHNLSNMTINNANGIDLLETPTISAKLKLIAGDITTTASKLVVFGPDGILHYAGSIHQVTTSMEFPSVNGPKSLFIENPMSVDLHANRTIIGTLSMLSGNLTSTTAKVLAFGPLGYLEYKGTIQQTTNDMEFPAVNGPAYLITNNPDGVMLHENRTLSEDVFITGHMHFLGHTLTLTKHHLAITGTDNITGFTPLWAPEAHLLTPVDFSLANTWTLQGTVVGTVDLTFFYSTAENSDPQLKAWNRSVLDYDPVIWSYKGIAPTVNLGGGTSSVTLHAFSDISDPGGNGMNWTLSPATTTLPVELASFTAALTYNGDVSLNWVTHSETDVLGYSVYRNTENVISTASCMTQGLIPATNTSSSHTYSFMDDEIGTDHVTYYYWLQYTEFSGATLLTSPVSVEVNNDGTTPVIPEVSSFKVGPNPFQGSTTVKYGLKVNEKVTIEVYNVKGQLVNRLISDNKAAGTYNVSWNGRDLNGANCGAGVYYIMMNTGSNNTIRKIVKF